MPRNYTRKRRRPPLAYPGPAPDWSLLILRMIRAGFSKASLSTYLGVTDYLLDSFINGGQPIWPVGQHLLALAQKESKCLGPIPYVTAGRTPSRIE